MNGVTDLAELLEQHILAGPRPGQCSCGWGTETHHLGRSHALNHLTEVIMGSDWLRERDAERLRAGAEMGWSECALTATLVGSDRRHHWTVTTAPNPYRQERGPDAQH